MSLGFRTISHKFTSFVNTRKQVTKIDRQLPKNVKTSSFLDEFLGLQTSMEAKTTSSDRNLKILTDTDLLYQNRLPTSIKSRIKWEKTLVKSYMKDKNKILHTEQQSLIDHYRFKKADSISVINLPSYNIIANCKEKEDKFLKRKIVFTVNSDVDNSMYNNRYFFNKRISSATVNTDLTSNTNSLTKETINVQEDRHEPSKKDEDRPTREHLEHVFQCLSRDLPKFFVQTMDYTIYSPDIIFVNNIRGTTTKGIFAYVKQVALLRTVGHLKFAYVMMEILKITIDPEDNSVKVRWRIRGITGMKVFFTFWKFKLWNIKESINNADVWYDGFSTYYVDGNGLIYKHVADKVIPDQDQLYEKEKPPVVTKLAMCASLGDLQVLSSNEFITKLKHAIMFNVK